LVVNILEGAISGKKAVGRPRPQYLKQVARNIEADSYTAMKRMACNNSRWKDANQSEEEEEEEEEKKKKKTKKRKIIRRRSLLPGVQTPLCRQTANWCLKKWNPF
jgi:hypothetical protein